MAKRKQAVRPPRRVTDLVFDPQNRRTHPDRNREMVADAFRQVGAARSIVIDEQNVILAGNEATRGAASAGITKVRTIDAAGDELIAVRRRGLSPEQKRALAIYDNRTAELAEWNAEQLQADEAAGLDFKPFWTPEELQRLLARQQQTGGDAATLNERFGVPPFSVLDARQGYWQDRKRAWLALGIESELGRGTDMVDPSPGGSPLPGVRGPRKDYKPGMRTRAAATA
jgi:hypothetical protein